MPSAASDAWAHDDHRLSTVARNVSTRYAAIAAEAVLGLVMLPFNLEHLGQSAYGLWMLTASLTAYFSVLDLGYGGALVKFVAQYRARRDARAINEIVSSVYYVSVGIAILAYLIIAGLAETLGMFLRITAEQEVVARQILLVIGAHVAMAFAFTVFGAVINGFQRYYLNNIVAVVSAVAVAAVNVAVLLAGYGLIELVVATTAVRLLTLLVFRWNAYRVFPALRIRPGLFRKARLREVTGFSVYAVLIDWSHKLNHSTDPLVIGAFLGPAAVAVYVIGQRVPRVASRLSLQLNSVLFPLIVDRATVSRVDQLRFIFLQATRLSLATVVPVATCLVVLAEPVMRAWVGRHYDPESALVAQLLALVGVIRVAQATGTTVLKGAGLHRRLTAYQVGTAVTNVALSLVLVQVAGLAGVAAATLLTVGLTGVVAVFPTACRRVELPVATAVRAAVWPALWPALPAAGLLLLTRSVLPPTLVSVALQSGLAGLLYLACFVGLALEARERRLYWEKARELARRWSGRPPLPQAA